MHIAVRLARVPLAALTDRQAVLFRPGPDVTRAWRLAAGPALTPELADRAIVDLAAGDGHDQDAYVLTGAGLRSLS
jgi:hypothetical protein